MVSKSGVITLLLLVVIGGGGAWFYWDQQQPKTFDELLAAAKTSYQEGDFKQARAYALKASSVDPTDNESLMMASFASSVEEKFEDAIAALEDANPDSEFYLDCLIRRGALQLTQGYASEGRKSLEESLEIEPMAVESNANLFRLLRLEGRHWEARPFIERLSFMSHNTANIALVMSSLDGVFLFEDEDKEFMEQIDQTDPDYNLLQIGQAKMQFGANPEDLGKDDRGLRMLNDVLKEHPKQIEAVALKGFTLIRTDRMEEYAKWREELPQECIKHPTIWATLGIEAEKAKQPKIAARCYWEALRLHPHQAHSCYALADILKEMDRKREAIPFAKRARLLVEFEQFIGVTRPRKKTDVHNIEEAVERLTEMGRIPEAILWCIVGANMGAKQFEPLIESLNKKRGKAKGWIANKDNPVKSIDLSEFPLPEGITIDYEIPDFEQSEQPLANEPAADDSGADAMQDSDKSAAPSDAN